MKKKTIKNKKDPNFIQEGDEIIVNFNSLATTSFLTFNNALNSGLLKLRENRSAKYILSSENIISQEIEPVEFKEAFSKLNKIQ